MNNSSNIEQLQSDNNSSTKPKNFNFIKKKNMPNNTNIILDKDSEFQKNNLEEINNISNNDINSDTKSFKSLKINNNFKNENISVILDAGNEDENSKSVLTDNNNNSNIIGTKGGFRFLKNKETINSNNSNKLSFIKKNQNKDDEKQNNDQKNNSNDIIGETNLSVFINYCFFKIIFLKLYF